MESSEACKFCGCSETNLVDGFYYCAECGTQDTNVRETVVEYTTLADGVTALGSRRKFTVIPKSKEVGMTDEWYRWHCLNFILNGLADELIELGANPTFKKKLLWVWTLYMRKFQNKADFGLQTTENSDDQKENIKETNQDSDDSDNEGGVDLTDPCLSIKKVSLGLLNAFLYAALNLDKSHIQLSHLIRFIKEGRISLYSWKKLVPTELNTKKLEECLARTRSIYLSVIGIRILTSRLFHELNLGDPVVPDLKRLVDEYLTELCLPNDLKTLVLSLMEYLDPFRTFDYLGINLRHTHEYSTYVPPPYELYVMTYILLSLKLCFGLDSEYEERISDAVDKINEQENYPKSYKINMFSEPTQRLFSFREWCNYLLFRKSMLRSHCFFLGSLHYFDLDDYVAMEHLNEKPDCVKLLKDEIAANIINKIPNCDVNVIPRSEFLPTMTPRITYTQVILHHEQDPEVKLLLSEDFSQYYIKYATEDLYLHDPESDFPINLIAGITNSNKYMTKRKFNYAREVKKYSKGMVYVKDCDNHNWFKTQNPKIEHVKKKDADKKEDDHGYASNSEASQTYHNGINVSNTRNDSTFVKDNIFSGNITNNIADADIEMEVKNEKTDEDAMSIDENLKYDQSETEYTKHSEDIKTDCMIPEEEQDINIFDDDFIYLDTKKEQDPEIEDNDDPILEDFDENYHVDRNCTYELNNSAIHDKDSDASSVDSIFITPDSLNREEAIKELVINACHKYKISVPGKYLHRTRRKAIFKKKRFVKKREYASRKGEITEKINNLIASYKSHLEQDVLHQMSNMVRSAVANINMNIEETQNSILDLEDVPSQHFDTGDNAVLDDNPPEELLNTDEAQHKDLANNDEYRLFGDSSDGETNANDLLPQKNPKFDEKTHDAGQLYIEFEDPGNFEMELNQKLINIIDKKIKQETIDPSSLKTSHCKSDLDDDLPLSIIQEQNRTAKQLRELEQPRNMEPLIKNSCVGVQNYWMKHYKTYIISHRIYHNQEFSMELDSTFPKSFVFVIKECADVIGHTTFLLYKTLQKLESCINRRLSHERE